MKKIIFFKLLYSYAKDLYEIYEEKKIVISASALTYYMLLSLVPVLSIIFGIAKGFSLDNAILKILQSLFSEYPLLLDKIYLFVQNVLDRTSGGLITGFGILVLCYSAYSLLNNIEISVNHVWKSNYKRSIKEKLPQYFMLLILTPILMAISTSLQTLMNGFENTFLSLVDNNVVVYKF
ncbi:MAG: YihY/virulence factor BrkB family protein, partial [Chitinophagaceae bacterium]